MSNGEGGFLETIDCSPQNKLHSIISENQGQCSVCVHVCVFPTFRQGLIQRRVTWLLNYECVGPEKFTPPMLPVKYGTYTHPKGKVNDSMYNL